MNKIVKHGLSIALLLLASTLSAQISRAEYWLDADPGRGNATAFAVTSEQVTLDIPTATLTAGWHTAGIRVKDSKWSQTYTHRFFIATPATEAGVLNGAEYFINTDPGQGAATAIPFAEGQTHFTSDVPTTDLEAGIHTVGVRVRYGDRWSQTYTHCFFIPTIPSPEATLTGVEYWLDADPGLGEATALAFAEGQTEFQLDVTNTDALANGYHVLGVRAKYGERWSQTYTHGFVIKNREALHMQIEQIEAYWDTDSDNTIQIPFTQVGDSAIIERFDFSTDHLTFGVHYLNIHAKADGKWSILTRYEVCKNAVPLFSFSANEVCLGEEVIVLDESLDVQPETTYAWDMDGDGKVDITDKSDFLYTYKKAGRFTATLTVQTGDGCETTYSREIYVHSTSKPSVSLTRSASSICAGESVVFKATPTNAGENPQYIWYLNDNILEDVTADNLTLETLQNNDKVKVEVVTSNPCTEVHSAVSSVLTMRVYDLPQIEFALEQVYYTDDKAFSLSGKATPTGGTFYLNGETVTLLNPARLDEGEYVLTYTVKNSNGCEASADFMFSLKDSEERGATLLEDVYGNSLVELHGRVLTLTEPTDLTIYTAVGQLVYTGTTTTLTLPQAGIYLLHIGDDTLKVAVTK